MRTIRWGMMLIQAMVTTYVLFWTDGREVGPRLLLLLLGVVWLWLIWWNFRGERGTGHEDKE